MSRATRIRWRTLVFAASMTASLAGCGTVDPGADSEKARSLAMESSGARDCYGLGRPDLAAVDLEAALADGLGLEEAVDLGLRMNLSLQARFQRIGSARADRVEAGLPQNPLVSLSLLLPEGGGRTFLGSGVVASLLDILDIPQRTEKADHDLEEVVLDVARSAAAHAWSIRRAYFDALAADTLLEAAESSLESARQTAEAVAARREAGAASELEERLAIPPVLRAEGNITAARLACRDARTTLLRLLSVDRDAEGLRLSDGWPAVTDVEVDVPPLVPLARSRRLDARAHEHAILALAAKAGLASREAFDVLDIGAAREREARRGGSGDDIDVKIGPVLDVRLPVFPRGSVAARRAAYDLEEALKLRDALLVDIAHDVRSCRDRLLAAQSLLALHRERLRPEVERNLEAARESYREGRITLLALADAEKERIAVGRETVEAERSFAVALARLEEAVGALWREIIVPRPGLPPAPAPR